MIRFNKKVENAIVSVNIAPEKRGKGYGSNVIKMGSQALFNATNVEVVNAYVKPDNTASKNAFIKAGYVLCDTVSVMNQPALHFVLRRKDKMFRLNQTNIGKGCPIYIIAELSANHNKDFNQAVKSYMKLKLQVPMQ